MNGFHPVGLLLPVGVSALCYGLWTIQRKPDEEEDVSHKFLKGMSCTLAGMGIGKLIMDYSKHPYNGNCTAFTSTFIFGFTILCISQVMWIKTMYSNAHFVEPNQKTKMFFVHGTANLFVCGLIRHGCR